MLRPVRITAHVLGAAFAVCAAPPPQPVPGQVWQDPVSGLEFCYCPPGTFQMGTPEEGPYQAEDQKPRHAVTLTRGFWLGRTELTRAQWKARMGSDPVKTSPLEGPVTMVSWTDCQGFLRKLNRKAGHAVYRLPTEAEWEYACEAGTPPVADKGAGTYGHALEGAAPEVADQPNSWGLVDMLGSVREWCSDWMGAYPSGPVTDPTGPGTGHARINRGGATRTVLVQHRQIHPTYRWYYTPNFKDNDLGFRVVRIAE